MRLKSDLWVAAYMRRCHIAGSFAGLRRRGAAEAGAIFIKITRTDGSADLYGPAPQSEFDDARPGDRAFVRLGKERPTSEEAVEKMLARQVDFDPDLWIVEVEDPQGRNFLDQVVP
ncbi:MAG: DUF1491 family protein [Rhizobiales bacterium]|nr:DUF1491 family protein [Hyphomicrobiales bacterium]